MIDAVSKVIIFVIILPELQNLVQMKEQLFEFITHILQVFDVCTLGHTAHILAVV
jgi:hypothetical protein